MKTREQKIEEFIAGPIKVGDMVHAKFGRSERMYNGTVVGKVSDGVWRVRSGYDGSDHTLSEDAFTRSVTHIGDNNFTEELHLSQYQIDVEQLLHRFGVDYRKDSFDIRVGEYIDGVSGCTDNPFVNNEDGSMSFYQREYVWTLEQKQRLIDSMYNNIDIGKFVLRKRSFAWCDRVSKIVEGVAFNDLVDGKQRMNALLGFCRGEYADSYGSYWKDLSMLAKRKFLGYNKLSFVQLDDKAADADTLRCFLAINHLGVPQSREHIEFVKSLLKK